jgi:alginate O-acetyltransferase complex protein AlgI
MPIFATALGHGLPGWVLMWVMAFTLFIAAKWITIFQLVFSRGRINRLRLTQYLLFWPGMDPRPFYAGNIPPVPPKREWVLAGTKTLFGATLLWFGVGCVTPNHPLVRGWIGMIGVVFLLHFGIFHLLSLSWRACGVNARPIMRSPATVTSLTKFWGGNWNGAFSDLMQDHIFKPLARNIGAGRALFAVFLTSGILHELVISFPAHGGYGLPTLYFAIQGLAVFIERGRFGRTLGLGSGWKGWCFVVLVAGVPAFWLFHPTFVHRVILPMLHAIGAT